MTKMAEKRCERKWGGGKIKALPGLVVFFLWLLVCFDVIKKGPIVYTIRLFLLVNIGVFLTKQLLDMLWSMLELLTFN